jgi:hypothetical protein
MRGNARATVIVLAVLLVASSPAQPAPPADMIGVFLDPDGCYTCGDWGSQPYTVRSAYLILWGPTADVAGWECSMPTSPSSFPAGFTLDIAGGGTNSATWPELRVSLPAALPRAGSVRLATFSTLYLGGPVLFGLGPAHPSSLPDPAPAYFAPPEVSTPRPLSIDSNFLMPGVPGAFMVADATSSTGTCEGSPAPAWWCSPIALRHETWGAVKGLYR